MISAVVGTDAFVVWSVPYDVTSRLLPPLVTPTRFEDRGWIALAAVELSQIRIAGVPLPGRFTLAAWLTVVDVLGGQRRGNYFLQLFTSSWFVRSTLLVAAGPSFARNHAVTVTRSDDLLHMHIDQQAEVSIDRRTTVPDADYQRLLALFGPNRSGLARGRGGVVESQIVKDHWRMVPHRADIHVAPFLTDLQARYEFAFDTSHDRARWAMPTALSGLMS